ncbi:MAG: protein kinase, partial [Ktedonobacterales bacterium]
MLWNDLIGQRLGHYEIQEELGRGGSSRVYRATFAADQPGDQDGPMGQAEVAIKVMPNDAEDRVGFVQRFAREVEAVRKLNHPNIVQVFDAGETPEIVYLVMQCVKGGTLRQRLGHPLPASEAANYIMQMAQALHHAHRLGIIHRDVKPSNMLVDGADAHHLLLTDFGTAKIQGARGLTKTGTTIGTPEYMAPEQAEGHEIDQRADIYALGCVLYEELAGRPPFVGAAPVSVLYQHVHSRPSYIRGYNSSVPRELARILEICLAKRPEDRYGTAELLADALAPFTDGSAQLTPAPWAPGTPSQPSRLSHPSYYPMPSPSPGRTDATPVWPDLGEAWRTPTGDNQPALSSLSSAEPSTEPSAEPSTEPSAEPSAEPSTEPSTEPMPLVLPVSSVDPAPANLPASAQQRGRPTIPLPNFRLPSKTGQLGQSYTADERQELEAMFAQIAHERLVPPTQQQGQHQSGGPPSIPPGGSLPFGRGAANGPLSRSGASEPLARSATSGP